MTVWFNLIAIFKKRRMLQLAGFFALSVALITTSFFTDVTSAIPSTTKTVNFQGRLLTSAGNVVADGSYNMQFKIYQDGTGKVAGNPGGSLKWTENHTNTGSTGIEVRNGFFSVSLGSVNVFGDSVDWNQDTLWLSMNVAGSDAGCSTFGSAPCLADGEMLPMKRITATPYALNAGALEGKTADNFAQIGQGVQVDASTNTSSIFINKTGSGNLLQLQNNGNDALTVSQEGNLSFGQSADRTISVESSSLTGDGRSLTIAAGGGSTGRTGGDLILKGGGAGTTGNGNGNSPQTTNYEGFEGASSGTVISTGNTILDNVYITGTATFSDEWAIKGNTSAKFTNQSTPSKYINAANKVGMRWYMMMPSLPTTTTLIGQARSSSTVNAQLRVYADGTSMLTNGYTGQGTTTTVLPTGVPIRVEWLIDSTTTTQEVRYYWGANLHGATPNTTAKTTNYTQGSVNTLSTAIISNTPGYTLYIDEWAYANEWVGPLESTSGGGVQIDAGAKQGQDEGGSIFIGNSNASSITIGSNTTAISQVIDIGTVNTSGGSSVVTIGSGSSASSGTTTIRAKNSVTIETAGIERATFSDTSGTVYFGNGVSSAAPDDYTIQATNSSSGSASGGSLTVQGGDANAGNSNGGNVTLSGGKGSGTGADGLVVLTTPSISTVSNDANCFTSGARVAASCNITAASVNNASAIMVGFSATGLTATLPDPTIKTAGRLMYIIAANNTSEFTLQANAGGGVDIEQNITMKQNTTASLLWNGSDWTVIGTTGGISGLQARSSGEPESFSSAPADEPVVQQPTSPDTAPVDNTSSKELFKLSQSDAQPTAESPDALLGSMYYDTSLGKVQCYEAEGWGSCGDSPDTFVTLSPEYSNAVMNGADIGTINSDLCSDELNINDGSGGQPAICGANETYNFYKWTTAEPTTQTRSIYVTHKLPATFKNFVPGTTSLMALTDSADSKVNYQIYKDTGSGLSSCGSALTVSSGPQSTWQKGTATGSADPSTCGLAPGDSVLIRINLTAANDARAYVSNLSLIYNNN